MSWFGSIYMWDLLLFTHSVRHSFSRPATNLSFGSLLGHLAHRESQLREHPQILHPSAGAWVVLEKLWVGTYVGPSNRRTFYAGHIGESPVVGCKSWKENHDTGERGERRNVGVWCTMNEFRWVEWQRKTENEKGIAAARPMTYHNFRFRLKSLKELCPWGMLSCCCPKKYVGMISLTKRSSS